MFRHVKNIVLFTLLSSVYSLNTEDSNKKTNSLNKKSYLTINLSQTNTYPWFRDTIWNLKTKIFNKFDLSFNSNIDSIFLKFGTNENLHTTINDVADIDVFANIHLLICPGENIRFQFGELIQLTFQSIKFGIIYANYHTGYKFLNKISQIPSKCFANGIITKKYSSNKIYTYCALSKNNTLFEIIPYIILSSSTSIGARFAYMIEEQENKLKQEVISGDIITDFINVFIANLAYYYSNSDKTYYKINTGICVSTNLMYSNSIAIKNNAYTFEFGLDFAKNNNILWVIDSALSVQYQIQEWLKCKFYIKNNLNLFVFKDFGAEIAIEF